MPQSKTRPCQRCGVEIPAERIEILPDTRLCIECSKAIGGEFDLIITPENLAKSGSLKKNYGGFTVEKKRKPVQPKRK